MNDGSDDPPEDGAPATGSDGDAARKRRELEQRERGLNDLADELDEREAELQERERELRERKKRLDGREDELDEREARIAEREDELDDREVAIEERERELADRADELEEKEETIQEFVNDSVRETVEVALSEGLANHGSTGRFGTIAGLILALVGMTLVVGGVVNGFASDLPSVPVVFANDAANLALTVLLLFSGRAANLAAVTD